MSDSKPILSLPLSGVLIGGKRRGQSKYCWRVTPWRLFVATLFGSLGIGLFLWPALEVVRGIFDPALNGPGVPGLAWRLHQSLSPRYAAWASSRIASGKADQLRVDDVAGTEWPLYGSVFYLWAEVALQDAWERNPAVSRVEPRLFARPAIDAAARLITDPGHAGWVRKYWGNAYLDTEDVFYRMLLIAGLSSHRRLTGSAEFLPLLRAQTDSLAAALDASPFGLLDDYPGQCYPTDVISAWAAIGQADRVLGTDHSLQIDRAVRAFTGPRVGALGLPAYFADARTGVPADDSRGCSNSNACMLANTLWPATGQRWYDAYTTHFWQRDWLAAGFREFPPGGPDGEWTFDIDAGPVVRGNGFAACAFGVAAARRQGRFDQAYPLSLEMLALSWPLPNGRLILPYLVSDSQNAPFLGEAAILFQLSCAPGALPTEYHSGSLPAIVFICLGLYGTFSWLFCFGAWRQIRPVVGVRAK